jgi:hypothetical protein
VLDRAIQNRTDNVVICLPAFPALDLVGSVTGLTIGQLVGAVCPPG